MTSVRIQNAGDLKEKMILKMSQEQTDFKQPQGTEWERQGLWCRLYVSKQMSLQLCRYTLPDYVREWGREQLRPEYPVHSLTERTVKMCLSVSNHRKQPECGQPGYAVVC